jgi:Fe(3+) dicitrate transport protein
MSPRPRTRARLRAVSVGCAVASLAGAARAQAPPKAQPSDAAEVRVIGSKPDSLQKTPGSGTVVTGREIERAQPADNAEILRHVPGVVARQELGGGSRLDISIRGLDAGRSRRVLILEDGMPLSLNPYSEPDMYYGPAVERFRGIEVVKGSGNILFGPQTLAGTINFLTIAPPDKRTLVADVEGGSYRYLRGLARYGDSIGGARYVVQVLHRRGDGFRDQPFDSTDALGKVAIPTGEDGLAMLKLSYHRDAAGSDDVGLTTPMYRADPRRATLTPDNHLVLNVYTLGLTHEQRFSKDTKLTTLLYAYTTDRVWRRPEYDRVPVLGRAYSRIVGDVASPGAAIWFRDTAAVLDRDYDVMGVEPRLQHHFDTGAVGHTLDFGTRLLRERAHYQQRIASYTTSDAGSLDYEERHTGTAVAAYVQDRIAFRDDLMVTPGIRVEHLAFSRNVLRQNNGVSVVDVDVKGSKSVTGVVPGIGMIYGTKQAHVFGGLHVGFAPPRVTSAINSRGVASDVRADESVNYELGTRATATRWLRLEATGFLSNFSNQVIVNTATDADTTLVDAGATNIYGVESAATASVDKALRVPTILELGVRYTFARAVFREGPNRGNLLPYAPQHVLNATFDVEHRSGAGGQIAYSFVGPQFGDAANTTQADVTGRVGVLEARHIVDATAHYRHRPSGLTFRLTVKNAFDATYIVARRPEGIFVGAPAQVLLGVRWDYEAPQKAE